MTDQLGQIREVRKQARVWMLNNDIRNVDVQKALFMRNHNLVADTLAGKRNNRRVLNYLLENGCPAEFLYLPEYM